MRLVPVIPDTDEGWAAFPVLVRRVVAFCARYPTELDLEALANTVKTAFFMGDPSVRGWLAVADGGEAVAHLLAQYDGRRRVAFVFQLEVDRGAKIPETIREQGRLDLERWARARGAVAIDAVTWHNPRVWRRLGFQLHRVVVRKRLETTHGEEAEVRDTR